jgi:hypothetical protein
MAATQAELDAINEAIRTGALNVSYSTPGGSTRTVGYRSLREMERIRDRIERELNQGSTRLQRGRMKFSRGL